MKKSFLFGFEGMEIKKKTISYFTDLPEKIDEAEEGFRKLKIGEEKETVLKKLKKVTDISSCSVEYGEKAVRETYKLSAFSDISFLHLIHMKWFDGTVVFEKAVVDGQKLGIQRKNRIDDEKRCDEQISPFCIADAFPSGNFRILLAQRSFLLTYFAFASKYADVHILKRRQK